MKQLYPLTISSKLPKTIKAIIFSTATLFTFGASAQSLNFSTYQLINGGEGQKGAEYRFDNVLSDVQGNAVVDCIVRIDEISAGVQLKSIDNATSNEAAFQPVLEHMNTTGPSWIQFSFSFVDHNDNSRNHNMFELPLLAASIYGLNGFDKAQEFAECDLGRNSEIIYETGINNLMVTRNGNAFRAENKWGVQTKKIADTYFNENFSLLNKQITGFKVKFGVTRKSQTWSGTSTYNLGLSKNAPDLTAAYHPNGLSFEAVPLKNFVSVEWNATKTESVTNIVIEKSVDGIEFSAINMDMMPVQNIDGHYYYADQAVTPAAHQIYYRLRMIKEDGQDEYSAVRKVEFAEQRSQVEMQLSTKIVSDKLSIHLPLNWKNKEVVFELFNDNGEIIQKVIEHKSSTVEVLEMKPLAAGSFLIKVSCGAEFAQQTVIHTEQL